MQGESESEDGHRVQKGEEVKGEATQRLGVAYTVEVLH